MTDFERGAEAMREIEPDDAMDRAMTIIDECSPLAHYKAQKIGAQIALALRKAWNDGAAANRNPVQPPGSESREAASAVVDAINESASKVERMAKEGRSTVVLRYARELRRLHDYAARLLLGRERWDKPSDARPSPSSEKQRGDKT